MKTRPWTILLMMLARWLNRHQQDVIEYLREENKILREKLDEKRLLLNDNQRMRLAQLGKRIGGKVLSEACSAFSPDTILMWHRKLIARKYHDLANWKPGKKRITPDLEDLIIMLARLLKSADFYAFNVSDENIAATAANVDVVTVCLTNTLENVYGAKECNTINNIPASQSENVGSGDSVSELNKLLQEMAEDEKKAPGQEIEE